MSYNVFMSYSRKDSNQADKIIAALKSCNIKVWVDDKDLPPGEVIESTLFQNIEKSTVFLFLISPDSVESEWCNKEINHAVKNGKRILPVRIRETENRLIPKIIMDRLHIDCREGQNNFDLAIQKICSAVQADYDWANYHTHLQNKVLAWARNKEHESWLIRGKELIEAESRISSSKRKKQEPYPTKEQEHFIQISKKIERKRKRQITVASFIGVVIIVVLLFVSLEIKQRENEQTLIAQSRKIAAQALEIKDNNQGLSLILALEAYKHSPTFEAKQAVMQSIWTVDPRMRVILRNQGSSIDFSPDGQVLAIGGLDGKILLFNPHTLKYIGEPINSNQNTIKEIAYSNNGEMLATLDIDGKIFIWDIKAEKALEMPYEEAFRKVIGFAFVPSYNRLILAREQTDGHGDSEIILWDISNNKYIGGAFEVNCTRCEKIATTLNENGQVVTAYAGQIITFDEQLQAFSGDSEMLSLPSGIAITPNGDYVIYGNNNESAFRSGETWLGTVSLSTAKSNNATEIYGTWARRINDLAMSQDGMTLVIGGGGNDGYQFVSVLNNFYSDPSVEYSLRGFSSEVLSVSITPDNYLVAASDLDGNVLVWDLTQKPWKDWIEIRLEWEAMDDQDYDMVTFSKDSNYITATRINRIYTWDLSTGSKSPSIPPSLLFNDNLDNTREAISPDGTLMAIAGESTTLIDNFSGQELINLGRAGYVKFSPNGKYLITYGFPSRAYIPHFPTVWNVNIDDWVDRICDLVIGNISSEEWKNYIGDETYQLTCPVKP